LSSFEKKTKKVIDPFGLVGFNFLILRMKHACFD